MADIKLAYGTAADLACTLNAGLASSSGLTVGRESDAFDNTSGLYIDAEVSIRVTSGTTPTAGTLEAWAIPRLKASNWPGGATGANAGLTIVRNQLIVFAKRIAIWDTDTTSNKAYEVGGVSIAGLFGSMPPQFNVFIVHNMVAALNTTAGNHFISVQPVYATG